MALDATQTRVGVFGRLYVAPVGTAPPAATATAWPAGWVDLGYLTEDGPKLSPQVASKDVKAWQSFFPVRTIVTERGLDVAFKLEQRNGTILKLAFGGGTVTALGGGDYKYAPPAASFIDERAFGIEVDDGTIIDRYLCYRGVVKDVGDLTFKKDEATTYDLKASLLAPATGDLWNLISNDPAMAS